MCAPCATEVHNESDVLLAEFLDRRARRTAPDLIGDPVLDTLGSLLRVLEEGGVRLQGDVSYALEKGLIAPRSGCSVRKEVVVVHLWGCTRLFLVPLPRSDFQAEAEAC
jgi:hypothetical protein